MRILIDANVLLDCLILVSSGLSRVGRPASGMILDLCDHGYHQGLVAWHTLPIISYYHGRHNTVERTAAMIDALLRVVEIPTVGHAEAVAWRSHGNADFEDALQAACALAGNADCIMTRNVADFTGSFVPAMTPEAFLSAYP